MDYAQIAAIYCEKWKVMGAKAKRGGKRDERSTVKDRGHTNKGLVWQKILLHALFSDSIKLGETNDQNIYIHSE